LIRGGLFEKQNRVLDFQALLFDFSQFLFFTGQQQFFLFLWGPAALSVS
jgi:hypothetical protein